MITRKRKPSGDSSSPRSSTCSSDAGELEWGPVDAEADGDGQRGSPWDQRPGTINNLDDEHRRKVGSEDSHPAMLPCLPPHRHQPNHNARQLTELDRELRSDDGGRPVTPVSAVTTPPPTGGESRSRMLLRFLRANEWVVADAAENVRSYARWCASRYPSHTLSTIPGHPAAHEITNRYLPPARNHPARNHPQRFWIDFGMDSFQDDDEYDDTGVIFRCGESKFGHPVMVARPCVHVPAGNPKVTEAAVRRSVYSVHRCCCEVDPSVGDGMVVLYDCKGIGLKNMDMKYSRLIAQESFFLPTSPLLLPPFSRPPLSRCSPPPGSPRPSLRPRNPPPQPTNAGPPG